MSLQDFTTVNLLKWSTMIRYHLIFSLKLSKAKTVHGLVLTGSFRRDSASCFSWGLARRNLSWLSLDLLMPMWEWCSTCNTSSLSALGIIQWCHFRINLPMTANYLSEIRKTSERFQIISLVFWKSFIFYVV